MEDQAEYITEAMDLLHGPSVEIEPARTTIERRAGEFREVEKPAFVKISTAFKSELPDISGDALKVWLFISLSVNRKTGKANPGLRTIASGVNLAVNTVQKAIKELEGLKLLEVRRDQARYNIYEVPEYVSANRSEPTVSNGDTPAETVSNSAETVSKSSQTVSPSVILNQRNQREPEKEAATPRFSETEQAIKDLSIENQIFLGKINIAHSRADEIKNGLRQYFRLTPRWVSKFEKQWLEWAMDEDMTAYQIRAAAEMWGSDKRFNWSTPSLKGIADHWLELKGDDIVQMSPLQQALADLQKASQHA